MSTIADRFPELTALHQEFMRALTTDTAPLADEAYLWYHGLNFERDPLKPNATSRGHEALAYLKGTVQLRNVPGQTFAKGQSPKELCGALISRHAADWEGPYQVNFRYQRNSEGIWAGFYTVETSAKHREIVEGREGYDKRIADAMKAGWGAETKERVIMYGNYDDSAAKVINRFKSGKHELVNLEPALQTAWDELVTYHHGKGVRQVLSAKFKLTKPTGRFREGDNTQVIYWI